ncbi:MAG: hypothetical protein ABJ387_11835 [Balneola sp.]
MIINIDDRFGSEKRSEGDQNPSLPSGTYGVEAIRFLLRVVLRVAWFSRCAILTELINLNP